MGRSEATKSSTMKVSIVLCLLLKLSKAIGEDAVDNIDNEEIHGTGLLDPPEDEKVDEASELYFNHFRSLRSSVPASYSSVEKGLVSPVKDQRSCGSCTAFASVAAIETCFKKKVGVFGDYSEQQVVDCGYGKHGAKGCNGAAPHAYLKWAVEDNVRLAHESQYPYKNAQNQCPNTLPVYNQGVRISNLSYTYSGDEDLLMKEVYEHGAVVTGVYSSFTAFKQYAGGIFDGCPEGRRPDHAVTVVGYGTENGTPYWLIKNSWGTGWGENGYIRMKRGVNMCGIGGALAVVNCETVAGPTDPPLTTAIPCVDKYSNCAQLCNTSVRNECKKSCNLCGGSSVTTPSPSVTCVDKHPSCRKYKSWCSRNLIGFKDVCRRTCNTPPYCQQ